MGDGDRYSQFKANVNAQVEYREAYAALAARDPEAVRGLPRPDGPDFDPAAALEALRTLRGGLKADPRVDVKG